jgi:hypothetical protein
MAAGGQSDLEGAVHDVAAGSESGLVNVHAVEVEAGRAVSGCGQVCYPAAARADIISHATNEADDISYIIKEPVLVVEQQARVSRWGSHGRDLKRKGCVRVRNL